ncbi:MAG: hypothetical protein QXH08_00275 [Candidatus Hadarchaeales archaeon]
MKLLRVDAIIKGRGDETNRKDLAVRFLINPQVPSCPTVAYYPEMGELAGRKNLKAPMPLKSYYYNFTTLMAKGAKEKILFRPSPVRSGKDANRFVKTLVRHASTVPVREVMREAERIKKVGQHQTATILEKLVFSCQVRPREARSEERKTETEKELFEAGYGFTSRFEGILRRLDEKEREQLLDFAEFLLSKKEGGRGRE